MRKLFLALLTPAYMFLAPFLRVALWVLGWAMALAALGVLAIAAQEGSAGWHALLFAFASGASHWLRSALPRRP
ncbi:MAG: hypothetical protein K2X74_20010 [Acetobacteraceae bacterium]|nr:hypothetical protein [Acetobacteraceae bacterium]